MTEQNYVPQKRPIDVEKWRHVAYCRRSARYCRSAGADTISCRSAGVSTIKCARELTEHIEALEAELARGRELLQSHKKAIEQRDDAAEAAADKIKELRETINDLDYFIGLRNEELRKKVKRLERQGERR